MCKAREVFLRLYNNEKLFIPLRALRLCEGIINLVKRADQFTQLV